MPASVLPHAARSSTWRCCGSITCTGSAVSRNVISFEVKRERSLCHSSRRWRPSSRISFMSIWRSEASGCGRLLVVEVEAPVGPQEQVVEVRLGVAAQRLHELRLGQQAVADQDLAEAALVLLLLEQRAEQHLLADQPVAHQRLADRLARVVRARPLQLAVAERQPLPGRAPRHLQDARAPAAHQPADQVEDVEGAEVAAEAHPLNRS